MQKNNNEDFEEYAKGRKNNKRYYYRKAKKYQPYVPKNSQNASKNGYKNAPKKQKESVRIAFLGGLNEIGKNMTVYECRGDMFIVDCGLSFPDDDLPGVDIVIPDFTFVEKNVGKIKGLVVTHGHEDHIGGIAYLLKKINVPVYATKLTIGLIEGKLKEHNLLNKAKLIEVNPGDKISLGCFDIELSCQPLYTRRSSGCD